MVYRGLITCLLLTIIIAFSGKAQVSHGGSPLPLVQTRTAVDDMYVEMPSFDVDEELRIDSLNDIGLRGGFRFAYKFMTNYNRGNSGTTFTQADGTRVWRLGIYSKGALSINLFFSEYELPEGAQVFLYNPDQTQILGAFTHLNNSALEVLPVSPVWGDRLIVEYHEPANAAFPGRLTVGEVNHGYRDLRGYEPGGDRSEFFCMPSPVCFGDTAEYDDIARSVVLITIDGVSACSGVMLNNTANDGKPYLLTASHCLNKNFTVSNPDYEAVAGRIVCFFNYQSPTCSPVMRGTEEMSVASAAYRAVNERNDAALLELLETPPAYYRPYYAGWNIEEDGGRPPYTSIHHPRASVKRVNIAEENVSLRSFEISAANFYKNVHWHISAWTTGSTASGSSGAPLFDSAHYVIGALSGGASTCSAPMDDYYYALSKAWESSADSHEQLKYWLDPINSNQKTLAGFDPYKDNPCYRLSNVYDTKLQDSITVTALPSPASGKMFGTNSLGTTEYAEAYDANGAAKLYGAYFVTPSIADAGTTEVEVSVYTGNNRPETKLYTGVFKPTYTELSIIDSSFVHTEKRFNREQESFISFDSAIRVSSTFYISYKIKSPDDSSFAVYNLSKGQTTNNTAWLNNNGTWTKASSHPSQPFNTSLFIDPVMQYAGSLTGIDSPAVEEPPFGIFPGMDGKTVYVLLPDDVKTAEFSLYSVEGKTVYRSVLNQAHTAILLANVSKGVYIATIKSGSNNYTKKIYFK